MVKMMDQYKTIVLSARYPYLRYENIKDLAKIDEILQKSLVSYDSNLAEISISGFKVFDYENSGLSSTIEDETWIQKEIPKVNLLRTQVKDCLSLSNEKFEKNKNLANEITDKIISQNSVKSKMEILNCLYDKYYKAQNNIDTKTVKSQNHALATFYVYFNEYLNLNIDFEEWSEDHLYFKPVQYFQINEMEQIRMDILKDFKVNNIDYAIESMNYLREIGYTELFTKVKSNNHSFSELEKEVIKFNQMYDLNKFKEINFGIKSEKNIINRFSGYIEFLESNYKMIQKASIYEVLNNRGTFDEYSEVQIDTLLDVLYSEFQSSDYLSIVDYDYIDNSVSTILNAFEQENEIGLTDIPYSNTEIKSINDIER